MMIDTQQPDSKTANRKAGRPHRLTLDMVLDAANDMGLENLSMKKLAADLGVGIATIYRYVADRDELIRLALTRRSSRPFIVTSDMSWGDVVREYAASLYSVISQDSYTLNTYMDGGYGVAMELEFVDMLIAALVERGFEAEEAGQLCRLVGHQVGGAALAHIHHMALHAAGTTREAKFADTISDYDAEALPYARAAAHGLFDEASVSNWKPGLDLIISGLAAQRKA